MKTRIQCLLTISLLLSTTACGGGGGGGDSTPPTASTKADLSGLVLSAGTLEPAFSPDQRAYTARVTSDVATLQVVATVADGGAKLSVNGTEATSGTESAPIDLAFDDNQITVTVAGDDGTAKDYVVTVSRAPIAATLSGLAFSNGSLSPAFDAETSEYVLTVGYLTSRVTLTPSATDANATLAADGADLPSGTIVRDLNVGDTTITITVTTASSTRDYTLTVRRGALDTLAQEAYAKATNNSPDDRFGFAVALSGDTMAIGAFLEDSATTGIDGDQTSNDASNAGAVYVFRRTADVWSLEAYVKPANTGAEDFFGVSLDLDGDTLVVGANREDSGTTGINGDAADDTEADSGAAYVFARTGVAWTPQAYLKPTNTQSGDFFGNAVAVHGDTIVVGAPGEDSAATGIDGNQANNTASSSGAVYVFERNDALWTQTSYIKAATIDPEDQFGATVDVHGDTIAVGAPREDSSSSFINSGADNDSAQDAGAAYVFVRSGVTWQQQAYIKPFNIDGDDRFGTSVALHADTLVVGAPQEDSAFVGGPIIPNPGDPFDNTATNSGAAYVFTRDGGVWQRAYYLKAADVLDVQGIENNSQFGISVAVSDGFVAVGAWDESGPAMGIGGNDANSGSAQSGATYLFARSTTNWIKRAYIKASNTGPQDGFGRALALSDEALIVGAPFERSDATGIDGAQDNDNSMFSGAVYVFR